MAHVNGLKLAPDCPELWIPLPMLCQSTFSFVALMYVEAARPGLRDAVQDWRMAFELAEEKIRRLALRWQSGSVLAVRRRIGKGGEMVSDWKMDNELTMIGVNWPLKVVEKLSVNWHWIGECVGLKH